MSDNKATILVAICIITLFTGWVNTVITAIQDESIVLGLLSIFAAPFAALYGLGLFFF
jgi:hypothetical protein